MDKYYAGLDSVIGFLRTLTSLDLSLGAHRI